METNATSVDVSEEEVKSLAQSILTRYGIDFTCYEPKSLRRRIVRLLNLYNFDSIHGLWVRLLKDSSFIQVFMNEVSVGMTSMFRDPIFWKHLKHRLKDDFNNHESLSIWHAGCSTGEEVYSMAILLSEIGFRHKTKALATDINKQAMEEAKSGRYHKIKMIENEANFKQYNIYSDFTKYYVSEGTEAVMVDELKNYATYEYHNLITDSVKECYDVILCRNVMIYFDNPAKIKLLDKIYDSLNPGGLFVIGFYDTMLSWINYTKFELIDEEAKIFRKR